MYYYILMFLDRIEEDMIFPVIYCVNVSKVQLPLQK